MIITQPPVNKTVCRESYVTISCGYQSNTTFPVTWIINGTSFTQEQIVNNSMYRLNNVATPSNLSMTVRSINGTTTIQCIIQSTPNTTTSTRGIINVTGMFISHILLVLHKYVIYTIMCQWCSQDF